MIGLDTNVLLRLFVEDDAAQSDRARRHVGAMTVDEPCVINSVVFAEFAWALAKKMKQKRTEVARLLLDRDIEPIVQITARDRNRIAIQADILGAAALGARNFVFMAGDPPGNGDHPEAKPTRSS